MSITQEKIQKLVNAFCEQNKIDKNIFEVSTVSKSQRW